ncbi:MAG: serine hydrolase [Pseudomonadales bacterium]|nr:serine hydrolase [Pseudomonadales bacterium]
MQNLVRTLSKLRESVLFLYVIAFLVSCSNSSSEENSIAFKELTGEYALSVATLPGYRIEVVETDGDLFLVPIEQAPEKLIQNSQGEFRLEQSPSITVSFNADENDAIAELQITNLFGTRYYKRLALLEPESENLYSDQVSNLGRSFYNVPEDLNDGLSSNTLESISTKPALIYRLLANLEQGFFGNVNSLLIVKNGELIVERYFNDWSQEQTHQLRSVSKSVTSLLIGSALDQGYIDSIDDPIGKYLPDHSELLSGGKENIRLKDLLTMSAGLSWDQLSVDYANTENINQHVEQSNDSVAFVLSRDLVNAPGDVFSYSDGYAYVAGEILRNATDSGSVQAYIENSVLSQLSFGPTPWLRLADGRQATAFGLQLRPRDLAKIGTLILNDGQWRGSILLSENWISESTAPHISTSSSLWENYGYFWWGTEFQVGGDSYHADLAEGFGGQYIVVVDALDLVVVSTAENFNFPYQSVMSDIMRKLIIPAFRP